MTVKDGGIAAELGFSSFVWLAYLFVLDEGGIVGLTQTLKFETYGW
jgi:hypothetical protein